MRLILLALSLSLSHVIASAQTSTIFALSDATLIEDLSGARANGSNEALYVGKTQRDGIRRSLMQFDLSAIPAGANVQTATLRIHLLRSRPDETLVNVHRLLNSWGEGASNYFGGVGGAAFNGDATWLHRFFGTSQQWLTPGGDFVASSSANEEIESTENITHDINGAGLAIDVQAWVNQPTTNFGWLLSSDNSVSAKAFASKQYNIPVLRPQLIVNWAPAVVSDSADVPLPFWVPVLLGITLFASSTRKRRKYLGNDHD